ncbi:MULTISPECIES: MAPEG family protein [unclassified Acinetobacter]|uniref:MAPEG family protein n=1 Tax=unclassified Acinetobacter TaxID=196816 RepID=UPI003AF45591
MNNLLHIYAFCVILLFLKMLAISCYQGFHRIKNKAFKNTEDANFVSVKVRPEDLPLVVRASQAWANDLENIPVFWVLGALCIALNLNSDFIVWVFCIFTIARFTHTVTYLSAIQPWRSISYAVGIICLILLAIKIVMRCIGF